MPPVELKKTPLHRWHLENGAKMVEFCGWDMPLHYETGILAEHLATRRFGGLFDVSHMGRIRVRGRDRIRFLQRVLSNNVEALKPWQAQYTLIPSETGGLIDDAYLYRFGNDDFVIVVNAANIEADLRHLGEEAAGFSDLELEDDTDNSAMFAFQGSLTRAILESEIESGKLPEPFHNCLSEVVLGGVNVGVGRTGYTGEPIGFELFVRADRSVEVWKLLYAAGVEKGILPVGLGARDTLRLEAGMPLCGRESGMNPAGEDVPVLAVPLASVAVSLSEQKGDFVGRQALADQISELHELRKGRHERAEILRRRVRLFALLDKGVARHGDQILIDEKEVGVVTSGNMIPYWKFIGEGATMRISEEKGRRAIGLAYVDAALRIGQEVTVKVRNRSLRARIVSWHGRSEAPPYFHPIPAIQDPPRKSKREAGDSVHDAEVLLHKSLDNHQWRQQRCINLIPSEMTPSPLVRLLQVSDPVGRYAEHKELLAAFGKEVFFYQGTDFIGWVENRLVEEMAVYLGCSLIEARLISGQMANMTVFGALLDYRNRTDRRSEPRRLQSVLNNHLGKGGHLSAQPLGALRDFVAKDPSTERFAVENFPVCVDNPFKIDVEATDRILETFNPELIIFGKSMVLHPEPVTQIREIIAERRERPIILYDMAHVLGLIGPSFQFPFEEGADFVTGSTHKTFFGPQRGIIGAAFERGDKEYLLWKAIKRRAFPGMVSNHHLGTLLALLMAALEMNAFKSEYQPLVIANAKAFARALKDEGVEVLGDPSVDFTETHQVIVHVGYSKGCEIARVLEDNNIIVNYQAVPGDESFTASSGVRLGVSEMTRFGMKENDFKKLASLFAEAVENKKGVADEIARFRAQFQSIHYCFEGEPFDSIKAELLKTF